MRTGCTAVAPALVAGMALLLAAPASSQDYARDGFYAGVGILGGSYVDLPQHIDADTTVGFELYGGYRLHPHFSLEGEFEMLTDTDVDADGFGKVAELESWTLTANAKVFPFTGRVQPYLLVGLGLMNSDLDQRFSFSDSDTGFAARFGGGLDYYVTSQFVLNAGVDYLLPTGDVDDLDYVSFGGGVQYRF